MRTTANVVAEIVAPESYPALLALGARRQALAALTSSETLARAGRVIALKSAELRGAVFELLVALEEAVTARDWPSVFAATHEIRGLAGTAGLGATGRIANVFCRYLESIAQLGRDPDETVTGLHLDALILSARTRDDTERHGDAVVRELSALVARKLSEIK